MSAMPSGSQRSIGLQRNWLAIQLPRGRPRAIRPSNARWKKTFWPTLIVASYGFPRAIVIFWPRRGSSALSSAVVASPRSRTAASPMSSSSASSAAGSGPIPASVNIAIVRLRSVSATAREAAAWTIGTSSTGTRNSVRRIASTRRTVRSSYNSRSISAGDDVDIRALACRKTLGESDAWITTSAAAASATDRDLRAGSKPMPQAHPRPALVGPDARSRGHRVLDASTL